MMQIKFILLAILLLNVVVAQHGGQIGQYPYYHFPKLHNVVRHNQATPQDVDLAANAPTSIIVEKLQTNVDVASYEYTDVCNIKQGFITELTNLIGDIDHDRVNSNGVLHAKQVFAVLNKESLSLFENQNANSLIKTVNLRSLGIPLKPVVWKNFHCFQLVPRDNYNAVKTEDDKQGVESDFPREDGKLGLCTGNSEQMDDWIEAIVLFENCELEVIGGGQDKQTEEIEEEEEKEEEEKEEEIKDKEIKKKETNDKIKNVEDKEKEDIKDTVTQLSKKILEENSRQRENEEKIQEERLAAIHATEELQKEQSCLEDMLRSKQQKEEEDAEVSVKADEEEQETKEVREALEYISQTKANETIALEKQHDNFLNEQEEKQAEIKQRMVDDTIEAEYNTPATECYDETIVSPNKWETIEGLCDKFAENPRVQKHLDDACRASEKGFCASCCAEHIGKIFQAKSLSCNQKCVSVVSKNWSEPVEEHEKVEDNTDLKQLGHAQVLEEIEDAKEAHEVAEQKKLIAERNGETESKEGPTPNEEGGEEGEEAEATEEGEEAEATEEGEEAALRFAKKSHHKVAKKAVKKAHHKRFLRRFRR